MIHGDFYRVVAGGNGGLGESVSLTSQYYCQFGSGREGGVVDLSNAFNKQREEMAMQLQYRELDRLSMELEKEIQAVKALRMEMEKYKVDFSLSVEDEATKKIQEVISGIDKMFKQ